MRVELSHAALETRRAGLAHAVHLFHTTRDDGSYELPTREELRPLVPGLVAALDDPASEATLEALRGLALAGPDAANAAPRLARMLGDAPYEHAARKALEAIGTPEARAILADDDARLALEGRFRTEYAPSDGVTRTRLLPFWIEGGGQEGVRLEARFLTPGREPARPLHVAFTFESYSAGPRFEDVDFVEWTADGVRVRTTHLDRSWSRTRLGVMERLAGTLPAEDFLALARAETLRVRLDALDLEITDADRLAFRHLAGRIPTTAPPAGR